MSFYKEVPGRQTTLESTLKFDTEPKLGSTNPVTSEGVNDAIGKSTNDVLDDHDPDDMEISDTSKDFYDEHELGYYYQVGNKIFRCTDKTNDGDNYSTTLTKQNGIVPILNQFVDSIAALDDRITAIENT